MSDLEKLVEGVEVPLSLLLCYLSKHMHDDDDDVGDDDDDDDDDGDKGDNEYAMCTAQT